MIRFFGTPMYFDRTAGGTNMLVRRVLRSTINFFKRVPFGNFFIVESSSKNQNTYHDLNQNIKYHTFRVVLKGNGQWQEIKILP